MIFKQAILCAFVWACCVTCSAGRDVASVSFRGDCTSFGMKIEDSYFTDNAFLIVTTGARFEYAPGELKIYQGLGGDLNKRLVATLTIEDVGRFEKVEANDDHILFWSEKLNIGIYGDSTCIIAPKEKLDISFKGNFKPDYEGRYKGELLLIDDLGGIQEETTILGVPCMTLRKSTERPVTIAEGTNRLADLTTGGILKAYSEIRSGSKITGKIPKLWDGKAAERIAKITAEA